VAFDPAGNFVGDTGQITRRVGEDVKVRVDVDGKALFGDGPTSVFAELDALSTALRAGNGPGVQAGLTALANRMTTASTVHASIGAAYKRLEQAQNTLGDKRVSLTNSLSELENVDLARTSVDLNMQEVAYQAALASTSKVLQHSLMDFMR
jgi:flagellar hook-associated protein 3 FlgL